MYARRKSYNAARGGAASELFDVGDYDEIYADDIVSVVRGVYVTKFALISERNGLEAGDANERRVVGRVAVPNAVADAFARMLLHKMRG